jgi:hypothetical protein
MIELATLSYVISSAVALVIAVGLWTEIRAFRQLNEGLGELIVELETAQNQMKAGIMAAIIDRANADEKPTKGSTAH